MLKSVIFIKIIFVLFEDFIIFYVCLDVILFSLIEIIFLELFLMEF